MFTGRFDHSIDEKGRVSIPARFREVLQRENHDRLYITNFPHDRQWCLALYPPNQWDALIASLKQKPRFDPAVQAFQTVVVAGAHEVPVDRQGRILLPPKLRTKAGLDREVTFSALEDHFELWDKQLLDKVVQSSEEQVLDPNFFAKLGL